MSASGLNRSSPIKRSGRKPTAKSSRQNQSQVAPQSRDSVCVFSTSETNLPALRQNHICLITIDFPGVISDLQLHAQAPPSPGPRFFSAPDVRQLALENLALRQQWMVLKRRCPRARLRKADRFFLAVTGLESLATALSDCQAGDGRELAPEGFPSLLDLGFQTKTQGATRGEGRDQGLNSKDG